MESYLGIFEIRPVYLALFQWNPTWEYFLINHFFGIISMESYLGIYQDKPVYLELFQRNILG